ncbi:type III-A CRISPR-associated RAMP protein Csm4 [Thermodesulforhabdus norvegica]|uniref:CRISPR system Cms protein Csm4 n=1 Tax=Thermodesulforhabdus norvegica TaxID=39841 RepID=A0A1I4S7T7_9BACT|nr:hypothetical protein [Thermodesulforhabdus norvegica]SFM60401.1 CRISPR-associated protein Csm4 [Thermodesulforhabdus norvegica]
MKLCEVVIEPVSAFGTPLKGDTLFGHFCWQAEMNSNLLNGGLKTWLKVYDSKPFIVFSSAFPVLRENKRTVKYFFPTPACPLHFYNISNSEKDKNCFDMVSSLKELKKKKWIAVSSERLVLEVDLNRRLSDRDVVRELGLGDGLWKRISQPHNSINRLSFTTSGRNFAPYTQENTWFAPGLELVIFVLYMEDALDVEKISKAMKNIGRLGFGRDASTGLGRFRVKDYREIPLPNIQGYKFLYTLSPFVPLPGRNEQIWFQPFIRFGRHGNYLAVSDHPFKNPVIMADEGAVIECSDGWTKPYVGRALRGLSKIQPEAVGQGYTMVIPCELKGRTER